MSTKKRTYTTKLQDPKTGYDQYASKYDERAAFLNSFENKMITRLAGDLTDKSVIDLGAGTGRTFDLFQKANTLTPTTKLIAVDISPEMLKLLAKKHRKAEIIEADIQDLQIQDDSQDIAISTFTIVHLKYPEKFFQEVYRILKPGGFFLLTNINQRKAPKLRTDKNKEIVIQSYYHSPHNIIDLLEQNFFTIEHEEFVKENDIWINQIIKASKI
ncbi:methyltransferase domain-containing protein [Candidatus Peregrinibacteria bacterium]|jgi:ubiquinone/menaquinone biosynthesis C-methylase UbiE|nr:methyltransferase domain-containing protein [Candidatus Peregrinibacteria bacterium]MBT4056282.1 methyltransferase domain-containing protein [Candidatus Peregrinibacteria bacterium]